MAFCALRRVTPLALRSSQGISSRDGENLCPAKGATQQGETHMERATPCANCGERTHGVEVCPVLRTPLQEGFHEGRGGGGDDDDDDAKLERAVPAASPQRRRRWPAQSV